MNSAPAGETADSPSQLSVLAAEWKQAWRPGLAALIGGSVSYSLYTSIASLFVSPLEREFGWTRGEIAFVHSFGLVLAFAAPVLGRLTDRYGVRPVLMTGLSVVTLCYVLFATMSGSLSQYYAIYFVFHLFGLATTGITFTRIISGAFDRTRGTALAIGRSGLSFAAALTPLALFPIIARYGTTGGYLFMAALIVLLALPLIWLWVPSTRSPSRKSGGAAHVLPSGWRELLGNRKIQIITVAAIFNYVPVVALLSQLQPLGVSKGLDPAMAAGAVSLMGLAAAGGALLSGVLVDRFWAPAVAFILNILPAIGCLFLLQTEVSPFVLYGAVMLIGLGQGAEIDIVAFMIARYFGLRNYATIYGITVLGIGLGTSVGATLIGAAHDRFGNYDIAIMACSASFALAAFCYLAMGRYPKTQPA